MITTSVYLSHNSNYILFHYIFHLSVQEMVERLTLFAIPVTLGKCFHDVKHLSSLESMTHVTNWVRAGHLLTLLGAFIADACIVYFMTIFIFSIIYAVVHI